MLGNMGLIIEKLVLQATLIIDPFNVQKLELNIFKKH
jgi:hypothetical protein